MVSSLYEKKNFLTDLPYIISTPIYEYDISKANINVLFREGVISYEECEKLKRYPREARQVYIGMMQKANPEIVKILAAGITRAKQELFEVNNIQDNEILSIKNDAVFTVGRQLQFTKFDNIEFLLKNIYSIYMRIFNIEIYFESDQLHGYNVIDVKGINDDKLALHTNGMLAILSDILEQLVYGNINEAINIFNSYYNSYILKQLPIEFYRTFDAYSVYVIHTVNNAYTVNSVSNLNDIDISYNLNFMRELYGYLSQIFFSMKR